MGLVFYQVPPYKDIANTSPPVTPLFFSAMDPDLRRLFILAIMTRWGPSLHNRPASDHCLTNDCEEGV